MDWRRTLAQGQRFRSISPQSKYASLKYLSPVERSQELDLGILDTSASVLSGGGLEGALGVLENMAERCYRKPRKLGIITFGNNRASVIMHPQKPPKSLAQLLEGIQGGGGTPLIPALDLAVTLLQTRAAGNSSRIFLLTDGRVEKTARQHSLFGAWTVRIVDMERARVTLGRARDLADATGSHYTHLNSL